MAAESQEKASLNQLIELYGWMNELAENEYEYDLMYRLHNFRMKLKESVTFYESHRDIIYKKHTDTSIREEQLRKLLETEIDVPDIKLSDAEVEKLYVNIKSAYCMSKFGNGKYVYAPSHVAYKSITVKDAREVRQWMANNSNVEMPLTLLKSLFNVYAYVQRHTVEFDNFLQAAMKKYKLTATQNGKLMNYTGASEDVSAFTDELNEKLNSNVDIPAIKLSDEERKRLIKKMDDMRIVDIFAGLSS